MKLLNSHTLLTLVCLVGCGDDSLPVFDAGPSPDAPAQCPPGFTPNPENTACFPLDVDAGGVDSGGVDSGGVDSGGVDSGPPAPVLREGWCEAVEVSADETVRIVRTYDSEDRMVSESKTGSAFGDGTTTYTWAAHGGIIGMDSASEYELTYGMSEGEFLLTSWSVTFEGQDTPFDTKTYTLDGGHIVSRELDDNDRFGSRWVWSPVDGTLSSNTRISEEVGPQRRDTYTYESGRVVRQEIARLMEGGLIPVPENTSEWSYGPGGVLATFTNGLRTGRPITTYTSDSEGRLTGTSLAGVPVSSIVYDGDVGTETIAESGCTRTFRGRFVTTFNDGSLEIWTPDPRALRAQGAEDLPPEQNGPNPEWTLDGVMLEDTCEGTQNWTYDDAGNLLTYSIASEFINLATTYTYDCW